MTHGHILHYFLTSQYLETLDWVTNLKEIVELDLMNIKADYILIWIGQTYKQVILS